MKISKIAYEISCIEYKVSFLTYKIPHLYKVSYISDYLTLETLYIQDIFIMQNRYLV